MRETRGQVFTLEGVFASLVVLAGIVFALQAVVLTPSTSGATGAAVDQGHLDSVLEASADSGALETAVLAADADGYSGTGPGGGLVGTYPDNEFGDTLDESLDPAVVSNVVVHYETDSESIESRPMIYNGAPGDGAVRATTTVALFDDDVDDFYAPDVHRGGLYNVVEVEVVAW